MKRRALRVSRDFVAQVLVVYAVGDIVSFARRIEIGEKLDIDHDFLRRLALGSIDADYRMHHQIAEKDLSQFCFPSARPHRARHTPTMLDQHGSESPAGTPQEETTSEINEIMRLAITTLLTRHGKLRPI